MTRRETRAQSFRKKMETDTNKVPRQRGPEVKPEKRWNDRRTTTTPSVWRHRLRRAARAETNKTQEKKKKSKVRELQLN